MNSETFREEALAQFKRMGPFPEVRYELVTLQDGQKALRRVPSFAPERPGPYEVETTDEMWAILKNKTGITTTRVTPAEGVIHGKLQEEEA